jgi:hypothetical protein
MAVAAIGHTALLQNWASEICKAALSPLGHISAKHVKGFKISHVDTSTHGWPWMCPCIGVDVHVDEHVV